MFLKKQSPLMVSVRPGGSGKLSGVLLRTSEGLHHDSAGSMRGVYSELDFT